MDKRETLVRRLLLAQNEGERRRLLERSQGLVDDQLVLSIKDRCYKDWSSNPENVRQSAAVIKSVEKFYRSAITSSTSLWIDAISDITRGSFDRAEQKLRDAKRSLTEIGRDADAAQVQVAHLLSLAMLGRYEEAFAAGREALATFIKHSDHTAAGKVELNLSNILARQSRHREALRFCESASRRFSSVDATSWYAMAENGLANTYSDLNQLEKAETHYVRALAAAKSERMEVTVAEIEVCIASVASDRGEFSKALRYLEGSRQRYAELAMPHQSAIADLEIAEIYFKLSLLEPAEELLSELGDQFRKFKMRSEEARARFLYGCVLGLLNKNAPSRNQLKTARRLFSLERNIAGELSSLIAMIEAELEGGNLDSARYAKVEAEALLKVSENPRHRIDLRRVEGRLCLLSGEFDTAHASFLSALKSARQLGQIDAERSILTELGRLNATAGRPTAAKRDFRRAIELAEDLHADLSVDEFGISFLSLRLEPFGELTKLLVAERKLTEAFQVIERGRSRSLLAGFDRRRKSQTGVSRKLREKAGKLRGDLNRLYKQLDLSPQSGDLKTKIIATERKLTDITRQLNSLKTADKSHVQFRDIDVAELRKSLGDSHVLVEFIEIDEIICAYAISGSSVRFFPDITSNAKVTKLVEELHFQFATLRYGISDRFAGQIRDRIDRILKQLYDAILRPLENELSTGSIVIVPTGSLYYVPFCAFFDGSMYLVERFDISLSPSASVWQMLRNKKLRTSGSALLMGLSDESIPNAEREIRSVKLSFDGPKAFLGKSATFETFKEHAPSADLIHLACHGQFRPDNPMFSSLKLADGWITVGDLISIELNAKLVTLSACETGLSKLYPGDEVLGLVRGFLSAGASTLVVSLWALNDGSALESMNIFYRRLSEGDSPASALRAAQMSAISKGLNPYYWSSLFTIGR